MAQLSLPIQVTANIVIWFFDGDLRFCTVDEPEEIEGIIHQLIAEEKGWA